VPDILLAADEVAATTLIHDAETALGTQTAGPTSGSFGPITASASATAFLADGGVDLIPPDIIRITDCELHYSLNLDLSIDLSDILPDFCLPQVCIPIPFDGEICTPKICIDWPTIDIPVSYSDVVKFTADFKLNVHLSGGQWFIDVVIVGIPFLQLSPAAVAILAAIDLAATAILLAIPFIGPFLALAVNLIIAAIGIAGLTGLLGPLLTPFVSGLTFNVYKQPKLFEILPAGGPIDPAVNVNLDALTASVDGSGGEDELVVAVDISP
jgi:hypothetical protein